ncbi:Capsid protein, T4-like bacteriophage [uncultured Caudovirales phage]|uniref:Capsid protein, T4-like bacteriophage n=1 Tax=uncultured Caudovirales phage TaxID=2100421 RepID=A0A6J5LV71_9CAUD|nr:Capsid protein, T4-like bacteriophage [uncultured Caudovirales phage]
MSQIQTLLESANPYKSLQSDAARLSRKWVKTGLLEGLTGGETDKNNMAMLLENQAKQLVTETSNVGGGSGFGSFSTGNGSEWAGIALPLVRKVFGQIAAKEFVSVQPMNLPSGLVFFLDFQYGTSKNPFAANQSLYGGTSTSASQYPFSTNVPEGGLYGAGKFTYSTNQFSASVPITGSTGGGTLPTVAAGTGSVVTASWSELNYDSAYSASVIANGIYKLTVATASVLSGFDPDAVRGFVASATGLTIANQLTQFTTYNYSAGTISFFYTGASNLTAFNGGPAVVYYNKATSLGGNPNATGNYNLGDFEDGNSYATTNNSLSSGTTPNNIVLPEINIQMQSQAITAKTKKLKAVWTPEFAQDLNAYQNIDAEAELTNMLSEYISMEIDLEILDMLIEDAAAGTEYWSAINNQTIVAPNAPSTTNPGFYNTQGQWFQTLGTKIQKLSNKIHQLTLRGGANFMVISPTVATIIESIPGFASNSNGEAEQMEYAFGVQKVGTFNGRYKVYKNPYMTENTILLGFRGTQFLEAGAVFAPYVPLIMTPLVYDPQTFTPRKGIMTRYAKKMLRPEFYAKVYVSGLNTL